MGTKQGDSPPGSKERKEGARTLVVRDGSTKRPWPRSRYFFRLWRALHSFCNSSSHHSSLLLFSSLSDTRSPLATFLHRLRCANLFRETGGPGHHRQHQYQACRISAELALRTSGTRIPCSCSTSPSVSIFTRRIYSDAIALFLETWRLDFDTFWDFFFNLFFLGVFLLDIAEQVVILQGFYWLVSVLLMKVLLAISRLRIPLADVHHYFLIDDDVVVR